MLVVVAIFGTVIGGMGLWGMLAPAGLLAIVQRFLKGRGLWIAVAMRLTIAVALWFAAPASYTPEAFRFLAGLAFLAALVLPVLGQARLDALIDWWAARGGWFIRMTCVCVLAFGAFLVWSAGSGL